jgi:hypothetical protein
MLSPYRSIGPAVDSTVVECSLLLNLSFDTKGFALAKPGAIHPKR